MLLATVVAGLAWLNWMLLDMQVDISPLLPRASSDGAARGPDLSIATRLDDKPLPQFLQTIARPLFTPTRRPAAVAARPAASPAAAPSPSAQGLRLIGLIKTEGGETRVLIRSADEPLGTWVLIGGEVAGWKVTAIGDSKVTVESGGRRFDLNLYAPSSESGETQR